MWSVLSNWQRDAYAWHMLHEAQAEAEAKAEAVGEVEGEVQAQVGDIDARRALPVWSCRLHLQSR